MALQSGAHVRLGYGSFAEYVERLFGYSPRLTYEKLRVAEALEALPAMAEALRGGEACWSALRELTRVATPATESEWLAAARGRTARDVEQLVSGHRPGSRPSDVRDAGAKRHVLRLEVSGEALATFRDARDGSRCVVPGCRHATFLDVHHIEPRADGGDHHPDNLITLCSAHHRTVHRGQLVIEGKVSNGLRIRHADGTGYGLVVSPGVAEARAKTFQALRRMGFPEGDVRRALEQTHRGDGASVERRVRHALLALTGGMLARAS